MKSFETYLVKHYSQSYISIQPDIDLQCIVVIPCYDETDLAPCLASLEKAAKNVDYPVEVIIVINDAEDDTAEVKARNKTMQQWLDNQLFSIPVHTIYMKDILSKKAGVGFARKIGMDEACRRFCAIKCDQGMIFSMDADTVVEHDYFLAVSNGFRISNKTCQVIYYEHDIDTVADGEHRLATIRYELHLRYYVHALRSSGFPHAYQTLGSAFAVKAHAYATMGGIKPSKAGEDFYFIQKFAMNDEVHEVRNTTVHPSPRVSHRVPFGTGKAISDALSNKKDYGKTYPWKAFEDMGSLLSRLDILYTCRDWRTMNLADSIVSFFESIHFEDILRELQEHTTIYPNFRKRFFQKMNAFSMMKYIHYCVKEMNMGMEEINSACCKLLGTKGISFQQGISACGLLDLFRAMDKDSNEP